MLIVNADDLGGFPGATDAILRCFEAGAITSSTLMVGMADSERAAALAAEAGLPMGLHLNLTQPFDAPVSPAHTQRQLAACAYFRDLRLRRRVPEIRPRVRRMVRDEVASQLEQFDALTGAPPTHIDSHNHAHTCGVVLSQLPEYLPLRRTASRRGHLIAARFVSTDRFISFPDAALAAAASETETIELMVHPSFEDELAVLLSYEWREQLAGAELGSFVDLTPHPSKLQSVLATVPIEPVAAVLTEWRI